MGKENGARLDRAAAPDLEEAVTEGHGIDGVGEEEMDNGPDIS